MGCNLQDYASHSQFEILSRASRCSGERSEGQDKTLEDRPSSLRRRGFYARGHGAMQRAAFPRTPAGVWGSETPKAENGDHPSAAMESPQPKNRPISVLFVGRIRLPPQIWSRFNSVFHAHNSDLGAPLAYTSMAGYNLRDPEDADALINASRRVKPPRSGETGFPRRTVGIRGKRSRRL